MSAVGRAAAAASVAVAALTGCSRPDWTDPQRSRQPHAPPPREAGALPGVPRSPAAAPPVPAWAVSLIGQTLRSAFPREGACRGNTDNLTTLFEGSPAGVEIAGWGWDVAAKARVGRVVLVDVDGIIVGAGDGGRRRRDVPRAVPQIDDLFTGWRAVTTRVSGPVDPYGVLADGASVCPLGHLAY